MATPVDRPLHVHRVGHWLPHDHDIVHKWLGKLIDHVDNDPKDWHPALQEFQDLVDGDPVLKMLSVQMFDEVPHRPPYNKDPEGCKQVRHFGHMLALVNHILGRAPQWSDVAEKVGLIGFPINAILDWPMGTASGGAFFLRQDVNAQWAKILQVWSTFLSTPASAQVLDSSAAGWFGADAVAALEDKGNRGETAYTFALLYACDPASPHYGFDSWDAFFVRRFNAGIRPLAAPDDGPPNPAIPDPRAVIVNACESTPIGDTSVTPKYNVQGRDAFWLKGQPYSVLDMFDNDALAPAFVGGTVYQAFLSALSYHRWHSPVGGTVVKTAVVPGTYYSENYFQGFADPDGTPDPVAPNDSQAYIAEVATRGYVFIQADNADIGLMAVVFVGMCEVSTCEFFVKAEQVVRKGDELGTFHFGGSTHCLVFRKGVEVLFEGERDLEHNTPVLSALAVVKAKA